MEKQPALALSFTVEDPSEAVVFESPSVTGTFEWNQSKDALVLRRASQLENAYFRFKFFIVVRDKNKNKTHRHFWFFKDIQSTSLMCSLDSDENVLQHHRRRRSSREWSPRSRKSGTAAAMVDGVVTVYHFNMKLEISLHYDASLGYDDDDMCQVTCFVNRVALHSPQGGAFLMENMSRVWQRNACIKLVCVLEAQKRDDATTERDTYYLGRPHAIQTTSDYEPLSRSYVWSLGTAADAAAFPGLSVRTPEFWDAHREEHLDMRRLNLFHTSGPLSSRYDNNNPEPPTPLAVFEEDHDGYTNPHVPAEPFELKRGGVLVCKWFNLAARQSHLQSFETRVRHATLLTRFHAWLKRAAVVANKPLRRSLSSFAPKDSNHSVVYTTTDVSETQDVVLHLTYRVSESLNVYVTRVELCCHDYAKSLGNCDGEESATRLKSV